MDKKTTAKIEKILKLPQLDCRVIRKIDAKTKDFKRYKI